MRKTVKPRDDDGHVLRKRVDTWCVRVQQVVTMAVFATALISGAPDNARILSPPKIPRSS